MLAPTRRAAPVMSTVLPPSTVSRVTVASDLPVLRVARAGARFFDDMEGDYDGIGRALNVSATVAG